MSYPKKIFALNVQTDEKMVFPSALEASHFFALSPFQIYHGIRKKVIVDKFLFSFSENIDKSQYTLKRTKGRALEINRDFKKEQNYMRSIEDIFCGFDSYTGIDEGKIKRFKHFYKLNEDEAKELELTRVFGTLYLDKTKHLYKKQDDFYYQITMDERTPNVRRNKKNL